jgi:hypothetical protein
LKEKKLNVLKPSVIAHQKIKVEEKTANPAEEKSDEDAKEEILETTRLVQNIKT